MTDQEEVTAYFKLLSGHLSGEGLCKTTEAKYGQSVSWLRSNQLQLQVRSLRQLACSFLSCKSDKIKNETA